MKTLFAVPWIESEAGWGAKPVGYKVFDNLEECKNSTVESSNSSGGDYYIGPERPLHYYETPDEIEGPFPKFVGRIRFKGPAIYIK